MSSNVDKVVKVYRSLAQIPALVGARLTNGNTIINSVWSQRNLDRGKTTKFLRTITISSDFTPLTDSLPIDISNELLSSVSPSEKYRAVLRDLNEKQYLEIWQNYNLTHSVDLNALDLHGSVYTDGEFGSFEWSPDEKRIIYIAELKPTKSEPFYKRGKKDKEDGGEKPRGEEYLYQQDWGEQLVGKKRSVIAQFNLDKDEVEILNGVPENVCPGQVQFSPDGSYIVGVAFKTEPRKLGLIYCSNRESSIFTIDFQGNYTSLPLAKQAVRNPIFTPDGKNLIWTQRSVGGPHAAAVTIIKATLPLDKSTPSPVLDIVHDKIITSNGATFYGLYNSSFIKRSFASGNRLIFSTNQKNTINSYIIDIDSGKLAELKYHEGSQIVLDVFDDVVLVNRRNFLRQDQLAICKLPPKGSEEPLNWKQVTSTSIIKGLENAVFEYLDLVQNNLSFSAIYLGPKAGEEKSKALVVWPHGGPHAAFANNLSLEASLFLSLGYGVLLINYRGSIGAGQDGIDFLLGKIGQADVSDCILATETALKRYPILDPGKLVLVGGSHGGFLVTHLSGQYPDMFKAVVARNPVIDVASMSIISDIPDWCHVEAGQEYTQQGKPSEELLLTMRKVSPIEHAHKVKAPTLLQIGSKDLRVPAYQGLEYYTRLKANGVEVKLNLYDDNHPLGSVPNEIDNLINTVLWIEKNI